MTRQLINIGTTANDGAGDPLRIAFNKINNNFTELYTGLPALSVGPTPPADAVLGQQWWDTQDGNSYIYYGGNWVPSTSTVALQSNNVRSAVGNTINVNFATDGVVTSTISSPTYISFVNYRQGSTVRVILKTASSGNSITLGVPATQSSNGSLYAQASTVPSTIILDYVCTTTDINGVYVTVVDSAAGIPPVTAVLDLSAVAQDIIPSADVTYNLGSLTHQWKSLYVSSDTIYVAGKALSVTSGGNVTVDGQIIGGGANSVNVWQEQSYTSGTVVFDPYDHKFYYAIRDTSGYPPSYLGNPDWTAVSGNGNANTGDLQFGMNAMYDLNGVIVENADLTHNATSAVIVPANGTSDPLQLNNSYGPVNITSGTDSGHLKTWAFGSDGDLTLPAGGDIKDSTGSSVLGGSPDGGVADNSAGLTITSYTLQSNLSVDSNSGSVIYNIRDAGASAAGIIIKGLTVDHTQVISGSFDQGSNTLSWNDFTINGDFWSQVASVTAFVTDSRGYTFFALVTDMWEVPHGPCLVEGTLITMADGTHRAIEDVQHGELIRVWNFDLGEFGEAQPIWIKTAEETTEHGVYTFSDGTKLRTVGHHVFNKEAGTFTKLKLAETPVGTTTFNEKGEEVTLVSKERVVAPTRYYNIWTQYHLNLFANGILTSNRFNNIYPIVDMKFVKDDRVLRSVDEFEGIDEKYINGLRLREQPEEYTAEYIAKYVHNRLERLDIANQVEQGI